MANDSSPGEVLALSSERRPRDDCYLDATPVPDAYEPSPFVEMTPNASLQLQQKVNEDDPAEVEDTAIKSCCGLKVRENEGSKDSEMGICHVVCTTWIDPRDGEISADAPLDSNVMFSRWPDGGDSVPPLGMAKSNDCLEDAESLTTRSLLHESHIPSDSQEHRKRRPKFTKIVRMLKPQKWRFRLSRK